MLDWADELFPGSSRVTYATEPEVPLSGSHPLPAVPNFARYTTIIDVEDDDDDVGPRPLPQGVVLEEKDGVQEFLEREERRRKHLEVCSLRPAPSHPLHPISIL